MCHIMIFMRQFFITEVVMLMTGLALVRYCFIFHLKNPSAFLDDFWHLFINLWIILASLLVQLAPMLFQHKDLLVYLVCCGTKGKKHETQTVPVFIYIMVISVALHVFIYCRILIYKYKARVSSSVNCPDQQNNFLGDLDRDALMNFLESFGYLVLTGVIAAIDALIYKFSAPEGTTVSSHPMLISPPLIAIASAVTLYWRNKLMRQWVRREIINVVSNQTEQFGLQLQSVGVS